MSWIVFLASAGGEWCLNADLPLKPAFWLLVAVAALTVPSARGALTTNVWKNITGGKWETSSNWSNGTPSIANADVGITNAFGPLIFSKAITIDATTASGSPGSMTISNLNISAPVVPNGLHQEQGVNELLIQNTASTPFTIVNQLVLTTGSVMSVTNSKVLINGPMSDDGYLEVDKNATLITTNGDFSGFGDNLIGVNQSAQMVVTGGTWVTRGLFVGNYSGSTGLLKLVDGSISVGSGAPWSEVGSDYGASGTIAMSGGTLSMGCPFYVGPSAGAVLVSGGSWTQPIADLNIYGSGQMIISGGSVGADAVYIFENGQMVISAGSMKADALNIFDQILNAGTLTISGGTCDPYSLTIGGTNSHPGTVWLTGGQLGGLANETFIGGQDETPSSGQMIVSNGVWVSTWVYVGSDLWLDPELDGTLTIAGGVSRISSTLTLGNYDCSSIGLVNITGGSLYVTNATGTAVLDIENGTFNLSGGTVVMDKMILTNPCANFVHTGGTLVVGGVTNTPGLFQITSLAAQGNNMVLTWTTAGGSTNQVQVSPGDAGGAYSTNGFVNLGPQLIVSGSGNVSTNYTDTNGATNKPARYYRVRVVP